MTPERAVGGRVDQVSADSERIGRHGEESLTPTRVINGEKGEICPQKKGFGQRTQEKQQIRETCRRPNRINLFNLTTRSGGRSTYFTENCGMFMIFFCSSGPAGRFGN